MSSVNCDNNKDKHKKFVFATYRFDHHDLEYSYVENVIVFEVPNIKKLVNI